MNPKTRPGAADKQIFAALLPAMALGLLTLFILDRMGIRLGRANASPRGLYAPFLAIIFFLVAGWAWNRFRPTPPKA